MILIKRETTHNRVHADLEQIRILSELIRGSIMDIFHKMLQEGYVERKESANTVTYELNAVIMPTKDLGYIMRTLKMIKLNYPELGPTIDELKKVIHRESSQASPGKKV